MSLGRRVHSMRGARGMSMQNLADIVGVSSAAVNNWENHGTIPRADKMPVLAAALGVSVDYLRTGREELSAQAIDDVIEDAKDRISQLLRVPKDRFTLEIRYVR